jgi:hypothetical protein
VRRALPARRRRQRVWFERWITEGYSYRQLSAQSGYPMMRLRRIIGYWLDRPPQGVVDLQQSRHVMIDMTYWCGRGWPLTAVMDARTNRVLAGVLGVHEASAAMGVFCARLRRQGLMPRSITTDGQPRLLWTLQQCWPDAIRQRCLVHIQRQGLSWCRQRPKRADARRLRRLFLQLTTIRTIADRDRWLDALIAWELRDGWKIAVLPERGRIFSDLKRARSLIIHALDDIFHYLEQPGIASSINGLEGYFGRLKPRYRQHHGLPTRRWAAYIQWCLHLCPQ